MSDAVHQNPVLLIHGIDDTEAIFWKMASSLKGLGWPVHSLDLVPNDGRVSLDQLAEQIVSYVAKTFPADQPIDLVGFSMGGIVSRYYVQRLGGMARVQRLVTIASPHHGTWTAYSRHNLGARQMRPNSPFLKDLNQDAALLEQINFTSIWTPLDLVIIPAQSAKIDIGKTKIVWVGGHAWMVTNPASLRAVASALAEPLKTPLEREALSESPVSEGH